MRLGITLLALLLLAGCTALAMGGGTSGNNNRQASVSSADSAITSMITGQLATDTTVKGFRIGVRTYKGTVTLTGNVSNHVAREHAASIARGTKGVVMVTNLIVVGD